MNDDDHTAPKNRSEIAFLFDGQDCNPNGDPLSNNNRPRVDPATGQGIVTDVRIKRYLRDQLYDDGKGILIKTNEQLESKKPTRENLYADLVEVMEESGDIEKAFLKAATDVRYFGATISTDSDIVDDLPDQYTGPVQFTHARSYHPVEINESTKQLTTVIYTDESSEQGTFATDFRIHYGLFGISGVVNENAAKDTQLSEDDVKRLDTLMWRAMRNQTLTRSKVGQQPRLYLRVGYDRENFHIGRLADKFDVVTGGSVDDIRGPDDYEVDATKVVRTLNRVSDAVGEIQLVVDDGITFHVDEELIQNDEIGDSNVFVAALRSVADFDDDFNVMNGVDVHATDD